jgi:hypothetical protein
MAKRTALVIDGLPAARAAFKKLDPIARETFIDVAVRPTASAIASAAKGGLAPGRGVDTGTLQEAIGHSVSTRTGEARVGIRLGFNKAIPGRSGSALYSRGARLHVPTKIGHLVNFGHGSVGAIPFMTNAYRAQEGAFLQRCRTAGQVIEQRMGDSGSGAIGGGGRLL